MRKIKRGILKTRNIEMKSRSMYWAVFPGLLYKIILRKRKQGNRPLFLDLAADLFLCYNKWSIASESVDELIGIRRCGTDISIYCKIYVPYFAHRNVFILDWMLGKGLSLEDIHRILVENSRHRSLYFLSELTDLSPAVTTLLQNHGLEPGEYLRFINRFEFKQKIPLTGNYFLLHR